MVDVETWRLFFSELFAQCVVNRLGFWMDPSPEGKGNRCLFYQHAQAICEMRYARGTLSLKKWREGFAVHHVISKAVVSDGAIRESNSFAAEACARGVNHDIEGTGCADDLR